MAQLTLAEVETFLASLPGWTLDGNTIRKTFTSESFPDAMACLLRLAFAAEASDHHPDVHVSYKRVTLTYTTHSEGGLTRKDIDGAREAERIFAAWCRRDG